MGLPFNLHIHLGRHTYAMMSLNKGVGIEATSTMLGHASTHITERVYATLMPNTIAERVGDKLNVKLDSIKDRTSLWAVLLILGQF